MKSGFGAFRPGSAVRPRSILGPSNVASEVPAIYNEMCAADDGERISILCNEEKRQQVKDAMQKRSG